MGNKLNKYNLNTINYFKIKLLKVVLVSKINININ